ncbi:GNAT family N-acetyltransferase [Paenibacillus pinihumi]|uniref:GNAT family N-acetyltransferase n=1 Tax=Paenibacillus pinihumi TaxID=669462 RepID=UPI000413DAD9|nr:GNAT family protein [Paenibacillus pinihumi]
MHINQTRIFEGEYIDLVPMDASHITALIQVLGNKEIWEFTWRRITTIEQAEQLILTALDNKTSGTAMPFTMIEKETGRIIGTTRIIHPDLTHLNAEIGCTWISPEFWRSRANTEAKSLLLHYCFEELRLLRVQFSVSSYNLRSQRAVERLGGIKEGVLRRQKMKSDGTIHDNVIYSILDAEWPEVKSNLYYLLNVKYAAEKVTNLYT